MNTIDKNIPNGSKMIKAARDYEKIMNIDLTEDQRTIFYAGYTFSSIDKDKKQRIKGDQ